MQLNDASRIIDVIDQRIRKLTASESRVETTWGKVATVSADGRYADLYLYGESAPYASEYFRLPNGLSVNVNDSVKAAIDRERGDRWVEEVHAFSAYNKVEFDIVDGEIRFGDGAAAPTLSLKQSSARTLRLYGGEAGQTAFVIGAPSTGSEGGELVLEGTGSNTDWFIDNFAGRVRFHAAGIAEFDIDSNRLYIDSGRLELGPDTSLYRSVADVLRTDDVLHAVGGVRVTAPSSADGQNFEALRVVLPNNGYSGLAVYALPTDTQPVLRFAGWGGFEWGPGGSVGVDVNLYRSAANTLRTDDSFISYSLMSVGDVYAGSWLYLGTNVAFDTALYREAANVLATDDSVHIVGSLTVGPAGAGQSTDGLNISGGNIEMRNANPFIDFKAGDVDFGARIIYDFGIADGLQFGGAAVYDFDNRVNTSVSFSIGNTVVVSSRRTGWGTHVGTANRTAFDTATVGVEGLAQRVKALFDDLTAHGLIGP